MGNLTKLSKLNLQQNQLVSSIPPELGNLKSLVELRLFTNNLTGSVPSELSNLTHLEVLQLSDNKLFGHLPNDICLSGSLAYFTADINYFSLKNCTSLCRLTMYRNLLTGNISEDFGVYDSVPTFILY